MTEKDYNQCVNLYADNVFRFIVKNYDMKKTKPEPSTEQLSDREVALVRELHERHGWGYRRIAKKMGISRWTVRDYCKYRRR